MKRRVLALLLLLSPTAALRGQTVISWQDAARHVGEQVTVEGVVVAVHCSPLACSLAFEPTFARFTAIAQARSFGTFPPDEMEGRYVGKRVRVSGTVETIDGKPRIEVAREEALALVTAAKAPAAPAPEAAATATQSEAPDATQLEILDRLDELLDRVEALSERLVAAEERMAGLIAYLDERERSLAASQAPPVAGDGAYRPGAQALRALKRGMSAADVERLAGRPAAVIDNGNGWTTWDYGGGRAITFDQRGRAQSLAGFQAP